MLPADFELPSRDISLLVPFAFTPEQMSDQGRGNEFSQMIARLGPGATIEQVNAQMKTIVDRVLDRLPQRQAFARTSGFSGYAVPIRDQLVGDLRTPLYFLQVFVLLVLLIACANVANLLLMRATGRYRELAIRTTLGAGQRRLIRQMLTEGLVLAILGGVGGLLLGLAGVRALVALGSQQVPGMTTATLQPAVLAFTMALALVDGSRLRSRAGARRPSRQHVVAPQGRQHARIGWAQHGPHSLGSRGRRDGVSRSVLLVAAGLLLKSFVQPAERRPRVSDRQRADGADLAAARRAIPIPRRAAPSGSGCSKSARALPGVTVGWPDEQRALQRQCLVGLVFDRRLHAGADRDARRTAGRRWSAATTSPRCASRSSRAASSTTETRPTARGVVVVDQFLANKYFANRSALGQQIRRGGPDSPPFTIVGVAGTINSIDLGQPVTKERIYRPATQQSPPAMALVLKTGLDPQTLVSQVRGAVRSIDPEQPVADVRTMDQWVSRSLELRRTPAMLLALFGSVALVLSAIGIYGVLAFSVAQRGREFGIRQALGADRKSILTLVLKQGLMTAGVGIVLGLIAVGRRLAVHADDAVWRRQARPGGVRGRYGVLFVVAVAACYIPARRATRIDPMVALRDA